MNLLTILSTWGVWPRLAWICSTVSGYGPKLRIGAFQRANIVCTSSSSEPCSLTTVVKSIENAVVNLPPSPGQGLCCFCIWMLQLCTYGAPDPSYEVNSDNPFVFPSPVSRFPHFLFAL